MEKEEGKECHLSQRKRFGKKKKGRIETYSDLRL